MTQDERLISYALNLSKKNIGQTSSNPTVGCVITKNNTIISTGITATSGRPHAETIAINKVSDKSILEGATLYVTLEPCSHTGVTSPCADAIIKHKFKKVVIATQDPDFRVNGNGIKKLIAAGIAVVTGIKEKEAQKINRAFFKSRLTGLPFITLKIATSLDGKIATNNFDSKWITSQKARNFAHHLRSINNAILVGANTVKKDNPTLNCRIPGLEDYSPQRVIISNSLDFDKQLNIFQDSKTPTIILTNNDNADLPFAKLIHCSQKNGQIDLIDALKKLQKHGINSILLEGGQNLATQFLQENLVDELIWIRNKKIIGNDGIPAIGEMGFDSIASVLNNFKKQHVQELDEDSIEVYEKM